MKRKFEQVTVMLEAIHKNQEDAKPKKIATNDDDGDDTTFHLPVRTVGCLEELEKLIAIPTARNGLV